MPVKASVVIEALRHRYGPVVSQGYVVPRWAFFTELKLSVGWAGMGRTPRNGDQRIDAWAMDTWPSGKFHKLAFEVKVTRSDFRREIFKPAKRLAAMDVSNQFYFVVPEDLVKPGEVPEDCGLLWVDPRGKIQEQKAAPRRSCGPLPEGFVAMVLRRAAGEKSVRGA